ncbi:hypothetical protein BDQ12DRAFT_72131 [Crucibulum laeve]|uniref:DUF6699 domain-containing protein n=1 Tax=Crucibulum laeve TaxID=68775 RepID=A0A5C3M471_9AGAR|nr:hypothetical protein BDQ12DRAFT_72131 [Crucibulum laeve]
MSSPYVYTPHPSVQATGYYGGYPSSPQPSPFIPDASQYPSSPYSNPSSLPGTPNHGTQGLPGSNAVPFPSSPVYGAPSWDAPYRERRPSWHGAMDGNWLAAVTPGHHRSRSFGEQTNPYFQQPYGFTGQWPPPVSPYSPGFGQLPQYHAMHLHPWLNGESPPGDFMLDLSQPTLVPLRYVGPGQTLMITPEELAQPATHPPLTRMHITCDMMPQWPVVLEFDPYFPSPVPGAPPPPITIGDILRKLHQELHKGITHLDYARLSPQEENAVSRAYTRRCRAMGSSEMMMRNQGVKRVDFLLNKVRFRGLVRDGDTFERMKLIVG